MRVLITGIDGYLGWALAVYLTRHGYEVSGIDNHSRRGWVLLVGSQSAVPISTMSDRVKELCIQTSKRIMVYRRELTDYESTLAIYRAIQPGAIVYLGEMPSAAYSMHSVGHAKFTHTNNINGTLTTLFAMQEACPDAHLIKLGTMGEYGTPDCDIPEGKFPKGAEWIDAGLMGHKVKRGSLAGMMFPRRAGSWYHQTKVHDSHNVEMACRLWGLRSTDVMQGVVYGISIEDMADVPGLQTRFDFDECFGTVINRFCAQAVIGMPLTVYGSGEQQRGFLTLQDSMQCLRIAIDNPAEPGEYRTFNQFQQTYSVAELAGRVVQAAKELGTQATIEHIDNPRIEAEGHYYNPDCQRLPALGYQPTGDIDSELQTILRKLLPHRQRIEQCRASLYPAIRWANTAPPVPQSLTPQ